MPIREAFRPAESPAECPVPIKDLIIRCRAQDPLARPTADEVWLLLAQSCRILPQSSAASVRCCLSQYLVCTLGEQLKALDAFLQPKGLRTALYCGQADIFNAKAYQSLYDEACAAGCRYHRTLLEHDCRRSGSLHGRSRTKETAVGFPSRSVQRSAVHRPQARPTKAHKPSSDVRFCLVNARRQASSEPGGASGPSRYCCHQSPAYFTLVYAASLEFLCCLRI